MSKRNGGFVRKSTGLLSRSAGVVAEALENRTLLSAVLLGNNLNITGTSGADTFTLSDDGTTTTVKQGVTRSTFLDSMVAKVVVNPSAGGDTVNLFSNTKPLTITGGGLDTVNIGNASLLTGISGAVTIANPSSFTNLTVDGSADEFLDGEGLSATTITGLSPGVITYNAAQLSALTIDAPGEMTISNTGVLHGNVPTVINGGFSTIIATTGALDLNLLTSDTVFVGQGTVQTIKGALTINTDPEEGASLHIDDTNDTVGRNVTVSGFVDINGLAPVPIKCEGVEADSELFFSMGKGNDTLTIDGGAFDATNFYDTGPGNDLIKFHSGGIVTDITGGDGNDTLDYGAGDPTGALANFHGGAGTNAVIFDESNSTSPETGMSFDSSGLGSFDGGLGYDNVQSATLIGSAGNDTFDVNPATDIPLTIHGGAGNDVINGGAESDKLYGEAGNDTINSGSSNDYINGGAGTDSITGGDGIDTIDGGDGLPIQIIADNAAAAPVGGSEGVTLTGNWIPSTSVPGFYGSNYITDNNSLKGTKNVKFTPSIPTTGSYQVYARWTSGPTRATNVPFTVSHQGTNSTVIENQQTNSNTWVLLGTFALNAGTGSSVTVSNTGTNGYVIADAVRFVPVVATASVSGIVFNDLNGNGSLDPGELGVSGRVIYIDSNKDGILDNGELNTTTDAAGNWTLSGLPAGTYRIREKNVPGVRHTDPPGSANFYDVTVTAGATASAVYGKLFGEQEMTTTPAPVLAINAGGPTFVLNSGFTYGADTGFTGGTATTTVFDVGNTDNDPIYYSYRSGSSFSYSIAVPNGNYSLVLNFVDPTKTAAGQRKFNVTVEGKQVLTNFDIVASVGPKTAISKAFNVTVTGGKLTISLKGVVDDAILSGFVLYPS